MNPNLKRAFYTGALVGGVLIAINHYDTILNGKITSLIIFKIVLTPIVPFYVSYTSAQAATKNPSNDQINS